MNVKELRVSQNSIVFPMDPSMSKPATREEIIARFNQIHLRALQEGTRKIQKPTERSEPLQMQSSNPNEVKEFLKSLSRAAQDSNSEKAIVRIGHANVVAISIAVSDGFSIVGCTLENSQVTFTLEKPINKNPLAFDHDYHTSQVLRSKIPVTQETQASNLHHPNSQEIAVKLNGRPEHLQNTCQLLLKEGYAGIDYIKENGGDGLIIFRRLGTMPSVARLSLPLDVGSEYQTLREAVVGYTPTITPRVKSTRENNSVSRSTAEIVDTVAMGAEHIALVDVLKANGVIVKRSGAWTSDIEKDGMFPRDPSFVIGDTLVIGRMRPENRRYETEAAEKLEYDGNAIKISGTDSFIEGGDVIILQSNVIAVGIGQRTNMAGFKELVKAFPHITFLAVEHEELHLDVLFTVIGRKKVLADTSRLPHAFLDYLKNNSYEVVIADPSEQPSLGCNVLTISESKVIAVKENAITNQRLADAGVEVIEISMPNIITEGGGPRCLTCPTNRGGMSKPELPVRS